jgi:hypothetical protein
MKPVAKTVSALFKAISVFLKEKFVHLEEMSMPID